MINLKAPGDVRPTWRNGVIQIHITRACDLSCVACTQGSNLAGKPVMMTTEQFHDACLSLVDYPGVIGIFGGNPTLHPKFELFCKIFKQIIPFEQRGLWSNNLNGYGKLCRETFNPEFSNLNVHTSQERYDEMKRDWPECNPIGLENDSRHSPPYVAMKDLDLPENIQRELIENCDINKYWSAMLCSFRGELRGFFCELAGAQSMLHQHEDDYPDTGIKVYPGWWKLPIERFQHQIEKHCFECGIPLRGKGDLAVNGTTEYVSKTHEKIYQLKKPLGKEIKLVKTITDLGGSVNRATDYIQNGIEKNDEPSVLIAIPTGEFARRADFYDYLNILEKTSKTAIATVHGSSPARSRNILIRSAIEGGFSHILFLDDDMAMRPDMLKRLLSHDLDMVTGLYLMRNYPHFPIMFDHAFDNGFCKFSFLDENKSGLTEIVNTGLGCCLIKVSVLVDMANRGFAEYDENQKGHLWITLGECEKDHWCDDISFFNRARKAGYKLFVDLDCPVGHIASMIVWPNKIDGKWVTTYDTSGKGEVCTPQVVPDNEVIEQELMALGGRR